MDENLLKDLLGRSQARIVTLEEGVMAGGFGAGVMEFASQLRFQDPCRRLADVSVIALPDQFIEHGARPILLDMVGLSEAALTRKLGPFFTAC